MQDYIKILSNIKKENYSPFYLLSGKETYFIDSISSILINKIVQESSKDFDFTKFYGQDTVIHRLILILKYLKINFTQLILITL